MSITPEVEAALAAMSEGDFAALTAKVRAPDSAEALRAAAAQHLSGDALKAFMYGVDVSKFTDSDGNVDQQALNANLRAAFGVNIPPAAAPNHGQRSGEAPTSRPGDDGRLALAKRHGTPIDDAAAMKGAPSRFSRGPSIAQAALARRHPTTATEE